MAVRSALLNVMTSAAQKAGRKLTRDFGEVEQLQVSQKGPADFVSHADKAAEEILHRELSKARPGFGFLMEEGGEIEGTDSEHRWIIDPLDGTTNFLHGIPQFAVSIAAEQAGEIIAGVIYNPVLNELYVAEKGNGAFFNDRRMRVSSRKFIEDTVLATGIPHRGRKADPDYIRQLAVVMQRCSGVRRFGAAALDLSYVAAGRVDGFWETGLSIWDVAAGILMVREAGGYVTEVNGGEDMLASGSILAANPDIHPTLLSLFKSA